MAKKVIPLLALAIVALATPAHADRGVVHDREDFNREIDIEKAVHSHGHLHRVVKHRIETYDRWKSRRLRYRGRRVVFYFDSDADHAIDRHVTVRHKDGELVATMYRGRSGSREVAPVNVWRPDPRSLSVSFPVGLLRPNIQSYRWEVDSTYRVCPDYSDMAIPPCHDFAPEHGRVTHRL